MGFNMEVKETGMYKLTKNKAYRAGISTFTLSAGTEIFVSQIDKEYRKFYSDIIGDWQHWEQPFIKEGKL
jgi:hypothetical protein